MKKNGFTLVELLAVIAILGVIALITIVSVNSTLKESKESLSETQIKNIEKAAETYYLREGADSNDSCVSVSYLLNNGYLEGKAIEDPKTKNELNGYVKISYASNQFSFKYQEDSCLPICSSVKIPTIGNIPNGNYEPGDEYVCDVNNKDSYNFIVVNSTDTTVSLVMTTTLAETPYITNEKYLELGGEDLSGDNAYCEDLNSCATTEYGPATALSLTSDWINIENVTMPSRTDVIPPGCDFIESNCQASWALKLPVMWLIDACDKYNAYFSIPYPEGYGIYDNSSLVTNEYGFSPKITISKEVIK